MEDKYISNLESKLELALDLLREAIDDNHIYGNDSEQWLIKAEQFIKENE